jgi:uncharacterized OB-fold protein
MAAAGARPNPVPDPTSQGYWDAAARHELALACCSRCGGFALPPDIVCPHCGSTAPEFTYKVVSGRGKVRSWTVMRRAFSPGFEDDLPFRLVDVELDDQPDIRMIGRLLDGPDVPVAAGTPVHLAFEDLADGVAIPAFELEHP